MNLQVLPEKGGRWILHIFERYYLCLHLKLAVNSATNKPKTFCGALKGWKKTNTAYLGNMIPKNDLYFLN